MARYRGSGGDLWVDQSSGGSSAATPLRYVSKWSIDSSSSPIEVTAFGDGGSKTYVPGPADSKITFSGFADDTATTGSTALFGMATGGVARKVYAYPKTPSVSGPYWFLTGYVDMNLEVDVNGAVTISGNIVAATPPAVVG